MAILILNGDSIIWEIDPETRVPFLSRKFADLLGFALVSLPPSYPLFNNRVEAIDQSRLLRQINALLAFETEEIPSEFRLIAADGSLRTISARLRKEVCESGLEAIVGTWEDCTAVRLLQGTSDSALLHQNQSERLLEFGTWSFDIGTGAFSASEGLRVAFGAGISSLDSLLGALPERDHRRILGLIHNLSQPQTTEPKTLQISETDGECIEIRAERLANGTIFCAMQRISSAHEGVHFQPSERELILRAAIDRSFDSIVILRPEIDIRGEIRDFIIVDINQNAEWLIELPRAEILGQKLCDLLPINRTGGFFEKYVKVALTGEPLDEEFQLNRSKPATLIDSEEFENQEWLHHQVVAIQGGLCITTSDITERKLAEQRLIKSERFIKSITASSPDILFVHDLEIDKSLYWSRSLTDHLGYSQDQAAPFEQSGITAILHPEDLQSWREAAEQMRLVIDEEFLIFRFRLRSADGEWLWFETRNSVFLRSDSGTASQILGALRNITIQRKSEEELNERMLELRQARDQLRQRQVELELLNERLAALASTDGLTGLNNHRGFQDRLRAELEHAERTELPVALILTDVDHFKGINDRLGHPAGDEVLREFSRVLTDTARAADFVARYGGEEFAIILPSATAEEAILFCERVRERLKDPTQMNQMVTASFGCADSRTHPGSRAHLISAADRALYRSKNEGRDRISIADNPNSPTEEMASPRQN